MLAELVRKREREKLRQTQAIKNVLDDLFFPYDAAMRTALDKIARCVKGTRKAKETRLM